MYSLVASYNLKTFAKVDQVQEGASIDWRQNFKHLSLKMEWTKLVRRHFKIILFEKCKTTMKLEFWHPLELRKYDI